jgi:hypothetical protein
LRQPTPRRVVAAGLDFLGNANGYESLAGQDFQPFQPPDFSQ